MTKFKQGDNLIIVANENYHGFDIGEEVTVSSYNTQNDDFTVANKHGVEWLVREDEVEFVKDTSMALSNIPITRREEQLILAFRAIERFNAIIGNKVSYTSLLHQCERVQEELDETFDAMATAWIDLEKDKLAYTLKEDIDKLGLLDGIDDVLVTSLGLVAKAEALGYDVLGGLSAVAVNNDTKYHDTEEEADKTVEMYKNKGEDVYKQYNEVYNVWVVKNVSDGKLRKPHNFVSVTLNEFLPKGE